MGFLVSGILFLMGILCYAQKKHFVSPPVLFCFQWGIITFLASLRLFGLYDVSAETWIIVLVGSICFLVGCGIGSKIKVTSSKRILLNSSAKMNFNKKHYVLFWVLLSIIVIDKIQPTMESIKLLQQGIPLSYIREAYYGIIELEGYTFDSSSSGQIISVLISTLALFVVAFGIILFVSNMKKNWTAMLGLIIYEVLLALTSGGRFDIAHLILEFVACYIIFKINKITDYITTKKQRKVVLLIGVLTFIGLMMVTTGRGLQSEKLVSHFYLYVCGDIVLLDKKIQVINQSGFWSYGFAGTYGFWSLLFPVVSVILGVPMPAFWNDVCNKVMTGQTPIRVGENMMMNAFVTPYYYIYADFRIFGVIFGMLIFGIISSFLYKKTIAEPNIKNTMNYLIVVQMLFITLQTYPLTSQSYVLAFILIIIGNLKVKFKMKSL